jgi:hypothetical protein
MTALSLKELKSSAALERLTAIAGAVGRGRV